MQPVLPGVWRWQSREVVAWVSAVAAILGGAGEGSSFDDGALALGVAVVAVAWGLYLCGWLRVAPPSGRSACQHVPRRSLFHGRSTKNPQGRSFIEITPT